ncbi:MAG: hypothetical protein IAF08_08770 [Rhizobacter sp.]|nr:hypothetical protein [Chlorobiales bacterium]
MNEVRKFEVKSQEDVWFYEKQLNLFDVLDFFPPDAIESKTGEHGKPLTIETDLGWSFDTDIERGKFCFRKKSKSSDGTGKWVQASGLKAGDRIVIEKTGDRTYRLSKEST